CSETIADYNYTYKVDWTEVDKNVNYYIGEKALCLHDKENKFILFYLIQYDEFNTRDYNSIIAVVEQFEIEKLAISSKNFNLKGDDKNATILYRTSSYFYSEKDYIYLEGERNTMYKKKGKRTSSDTSLNFNTLQRFKKCRISTTSALTSSSTSFSAIS
ncbi:3060_t:CDS:2, partial [Dentiscutata heterogama]